MPKLENTFEALSFRYFLLDNYKKLKISEDELCVLLMCDHLIKEGNLFITADLLRLKMNFHTSTLDQILVKLLDKKYIEYVSSDNGMITSLEPLKKKLYNLFQVEMSKDRTVLQSKERSQILSSLFKTFEDSLKRKLSPLEKDTISSWLDDDFTPDQIRDALSFGISSKKKTIRAIGNILNDIRTKDDVAKEGVSAVKKDVWSKNIEKTMEIAKANWLDDDK